MMAKPAIHIILPSGDARGMRVAQIIRAGGRAATSGFRLLFLAWSLLVGGVIGAQTPAPAAVPARAERFVPAPGPDAFAEAVLQEAIDAAAAAGGGVVLLGAGDFKLSRRAGDETVVIKSGITLRGQGFATHLYLDPKTPPNPVRYFPIRIGTARTPASNVVIEHLRYTGHDRAIGGGSIMGLNARLEERDALLLSCDNVTVRHCWIYDAKQSVGCSKPATGYGSPERLAAQFKNWQVHHNFIDTCGNKGIELAQCNGGLIGDNYLTNVVDGPQVIHGSRNVQIRDNVVYFTRTGINISEGSNHIRVSGNHVEPVETIQSAEATACLLFRTEPMPIDSKVSHVVITGNVFRDQTTRLKKTVQFITRPESLSCTYEAITMTGNVFDGNVLFLDPTSPGKTTIQDVILADNVCEGDVISLPRETMMSRRVMVRGNQLRKSGQYELAASGWIWSGNSHIRGSLVIPAGAEGNVVHGNVTTVEIAASGSKTDLADNVILPEKQ